MPGLIGRKVGMTSVYDENRRAIPCTLIEAGPCVVTQVRTEDKDGYQALQLGFGDRKEKNTPAAVMGHLEKAGTGPKQVLMESEYFVPTYYKKVSNTDEETGTTTESYEEVEGEELKMGDTLDVTIFRPGEWVDVVGKSKGKGFQGVVKRHGFAGVGGQTHGQHNRNRAPGSLGPGSTPSRVFKGMRMAGRTGGNRVKVQNLRVLKVIPEKNLLVISGSIPGHKGSIVYIEK